MVAQGVWRNRVVRTEQVAPDQLLASPWNFRLHPQHQQAALQGVIDEIGFVAPVLVSVHSGRVLDGHLRVTLALRQDQPTIPVTYVDVTEDEEKLILLTMDPLAALAGTDTDLLADLLHQVSTPHPDVQTMLDQLAAQHGVTPPAFVPAGEETQGRLDTLAGTVTCPHCGGTFHP